MNCVFCEKPEIKERTLAENDLAFAFLTNIPITPGHTLVSPKRCATIFLDLTTDEKTAIFQLIDKMRTALKKTFGAEGFNFAWNEGVVGGQGVSHFHFHIVPRKKGDSGIIEYKPRKFLYRPGSRAETPEKELREIVLEIKKSL